MVVNKSSLANSNGASFSSQNRYGVATVPGLEKRGPLMPKPQLIFKDKVDNSELPFLPKIRQKQNAIKPLSSKQTNKT
jgi:hypothetical protein